MEKIFIEVFSFYFMLELGENIRDIGRGSILEKRKERIKMVISRGDKSVKNSSWELSIIIGGITSTVCSICNVINKLNKDKE